MTGVSRLVLVVVLLFAGSFSVAMAFDVKEAKAVFLQAVQAYHDGHYDDAVALNEQIMAGGYYSPTLYYNLGNAYFKSRHTGKALVNYLRARRLAPRDSDLRANLMFARTVVENYAPWKDGSIFAPPADLLSGEELQWLAFFFFVLTGSFLIFALYAGLRRKRIVLFTGLLALVSAYLGGAGIFKVLQRSGEAVCITRADARFEPSPQATVYFKVPEGTEVRVLRYKVLWCKIERADGKLGWVPAASLERI